MKSDFQPISPSKQRREPFASLLHSLTLAAFLLSAVQGIAQAPANAQAAALLARARAQEQAGRTDLAAQTWQQVLLVDAKDRDALAGLARAAKLAGRDTEAKSYLDRLRRIDPTNSEISKIEGTGSSQSQAAQLQQAARLAQAGHPDDALRLYREAWGGQPPDGDWALAYYDTEASVETERPDAIAHLQALARKYPADARYAITLGRILTYTPKSRAEGLHMLQPLANHPAAQEAIRQARAWDAQSVAAVPKAAPTTNTGIAQGALEAAAFSALAANRVEDAQERFLALRSEQPANARVAAGLGFLRMKQNNFPAAIVLLEEAQSNGLRRKEVDEALKTARFWAAVQHGTEALNADRIDEAVGAFKAALALRPDSTDALAGLSGTYMKAADPAAAITIYRQWVKLQPGSPDAWRGMFAAQVQAGQAAEAIETAKKFPARVKADLQRSPDFYRNLAAAYVATGQPAEAEATLEEALRLTSSDDAHSGTMDTRLQYAGLLADTKRSAQAAQLYREILYDDPESLPAWQGLIGLQHQTGHDAEAVATVQRMSPATYEDALQDSGFLAMMAGIYQQQNRFELALQLLRRAEANDMAKHESLPVPLQVQMASILLRQNQPDQAYAIFRNVLGGHPDRVDAWKGLISALHQTHRDRDALAQMLLIPVTIRRELDRDVDYEQTVANVYAATGNQSAALQLIEQIQAHYRSTRGTAPAEVDIQNAWLLYNTHDDRDLYRALMALGGRDDLVDDQRRVVETIWATWSVRRAGEAVDAGNTKRSVEILRVAYEAFPNNTDVSKALAGGYLKAGDPRRAMAIYIALRINNPSASDYQGMVSAALAAPDLHQAEAWLRAALEKFSNDAQILSLAARFEQARGDHTRAAGYWKASLAAMPAVDPANRLAHVLDRAEIGSAPHNQASLSSLLDPDSDVAARVSRPPLPSYQNTYAGTQQALRPGPAVTTYGPDPFLQGTAPVRMDGANVRDTAWKDGDGMISSSRQPDDSTPGTGARARLGSESKLSLFDPSAKSQELFDNADAFAPPSIVRETETATLAANTGAKMTASTEESSVSRVQNISAEQDWPVPPTGNTSASAPPTPHLRSHRRAQPQATAALPLTPESFTHDVTPEEATEPNAAIHFLANQPSSAPMSPPDRAEPQTRAAELTSEIRYIEPQAAATRSQVLPQQRQGTAKKWATPQPTAPELEVPLQAHNVGATDVQLQQQNLPPLRGPWNSQPVALESDPRSEGELQLAVIDAGYSGWKGGTGYISHRSGTAGFDQLEILEAPFETSATIGGSARLTAIVTPSLLDAGVSDGTSLDRLGTLAVGSIAAQQNSTGVGGEVQLTTSNFGLSAGTTPRGFLLPNFTGRVSIHPASSPLTLNFVREGIKDSQLSYAGLRDPGSSSATYAGNLWGGVVSNAGNVQYSRGDDASGYYAGIGGQYITGLNVQTNNRIDGVAGAYWKVLKVPDTAEVTVGANFFGMHYAHNLRYFTFGQGGYFSPDVYLLANVPFTIKGQYGNRLHYTIAGALGLQAFQEDSSLYFPTHVYAATPAAPVTPVTPINPSETFAHLHPIVPIAPIVPTPVAFINPSYPSQSVVGGNYDLHAEVSDHVIDRWYIGGFISLNNTRDYANQSVGFFIRYMSRPQDLTEGAPTGLFPAQGLRPLLVP